MNVTKKLAIIISALMIALSACGCSTSGDEYANEIYKSTDTTGSAPDTASPNAPETDAPGQDEADLTDPDKSESTAYDQDDTELTAPDKSEPTAAAPDKSEPSKSASDKSEPSKSSPTTTAPDKRESEAPTQKSDRPASTNKPTDSGEGKAETTAPSGAPDRAPEGAPETAPKTDGRGADTADEYEREVVRLVNEIRRARGLHELEYDEELTKVARLKSQDMNELGYFSHTSPTYGSPFDMMKSFGITYRAAGENIARGYRTPEAVVDGWMNSDGHRANILSDKFTRIGVGYVADGSYWTQMFRG